MTGRLPSVRAGDDGVARCWWCGDDPLYVEYHDQEWGRPSHDDRHLFEHICLEGFQAGLSWITILRKRDAFNEAFQGFEIDRVARFTVRRVDKLVHNAGIIRHRGKIESAINNARRAIELAEEYGSLDSYFWSYAPKRQRLRVTRRTMPVTSRKSVAMSRDLKRRGWTFVGPTGLYAFMQACGLVNDHVTGCDHR